MCLSTTRVSSLGFVSTNRPTNRRVCLLTTQVSTRVCCYQPLSLLSQGAPSVHSPIYCQMSCVYSYYIIRGRIVVNQAKVHGKRNFYIECCCKFMPLQGSGYPAQGSRVGAVVRELAFHQYVPGSIPGPGVICGLSLLVLYSAPRGFSPGTPVFPSPQKPTFNLI